jgi:hypothetical protein
MAAALREAASWVNCDAIRIEEMQPRKLTAALRKEVK